MSFPTNLTPLPRMYQTGIVVGIYPSSDPQQATEIQRKLSTQTSTQWVTIGFLYQENGHGPIQFPDVVPEDGKVRDYRARTNGPQTSAGSWTPTKSARAGLLPLNRLSVPPMSAAGIGPRSTADGSLSTSNWPTT